jgi:hypothetical protein
LEKKVLAGLIDPWIIARHVFPDIELPNAPVPVRGPEPELQIIQVEEIPGHWLTRMWNEERRETPQFVRQRERQQELKDPRRLLKKDGKFIKIVRALRRMPPDRRPRALRDFWE